MLLYGTKIQKLPKKRMNCYHIWHVCRDLICQIYIKGNLVANEIWWNILGWGENWCFKRGDKSKRETIIRFSRYQIVKATGGYYKWKINIPMFNCIICQIYLFNTVIISSTGFSAYSNGFLIFICTRVPQREIM